MTQAQFKLRVDPRNRITLPKDAIPQSTSGFICKVKGNGDIVLTPLVEIPEREKWLYQDKDALASFEVGLKQAENGDFVTAPRGV